ncbi:hypothetical protein [Nocardia phage KYD2]|nr:hypothetical protein [Nocardia phage KYD2]
MAGKVVQLTLVLRDDAGDDATQAILDVFTHRVAPAVLSAKADDRVVVERGWLTVDGVMVDG